MAKLTPNMQYALDKMKGAHYRYQDVDRKASIQLMSADGELPKLSDYYFVRKDGTLLVHESTRTLHGLEKRGLIRVLKAGGDFPDVIELHGFEAPEMLTQAVRIKVDMDLPFPKYEYAPVDQVLKLQARVAEVYGGDPRLRAIGEPEIVDLTILF